MRLDEDDKQRYSFVNTVTGDLQTPLHYAVRKERLAIVDLLLLAGADVLKHDIQGNNVFHMSAEAKGNLHLVAQFLDICDHEVAHGKHPLSYRDLATTANKSGMTPLHVACVSTHGTIGPVKDAIIKMLVTRHPQDVNVPCGRKTAAHFLSQKPGEASVLEWLIENHGLDVNPGQPAMRHKSKDHAARQLMVHLDSAAGEAGNTPLHLACFHGRMEAMQVLLKHGANTDVCNLKGEVPRLPRRNPPPMLYLEPKDVSGKGHWRLRGRHWKEGVIILMSSALPPSTSLVYL